MSEDDLFAQAMGIVTPLAKEGKVQAKTTKNKHDILRSIEAKELQTTHSQHHARLSVQRFSTYELKADSVSTKDVKKLAQMNISLELDLHGLTQAQAEQTMQHFFNQAIHHSERYLCIIHGQGRHSKDGKSVLKDLTYQWLEHGSFSSHILIAIPSKQSGGG
ncbi:MAG: Smr/MutS family protein, partial [Ghiorsea sp.]|nr:Smr/MutS family protein [Ghiorsea sp.]